MDYPQKLTHKTPRICKTVVKKRKRRVAKFIDEEPRRIVVRNMMRSIVMWTRKNPHVIGVVILFSLLFSFKVLNLISSLCLGFVVASLSDYFVQSFLEWQKEKKANEDEAEGKSRILQNRKIRNQIFEVNAKPKSHISLKKRGYSKN